MAGVRTYKITCDECGYSEEVSSAQLTYEEGKTCPRCLKGKMYWVPPAEEARRREFQKIYGQGGRTMQEERISPVIIIAVGLGLAVAAVVGIAAIARAAAPPGCLTLLPGRFYYFTYTGPSQTFQAGLGECYPVIWTIDVYDPETDDYWPPADPVNDILETGSKCRVKVQGICTLCGFELI